MKKWYKSKTIWTNLIAIAVALGLQLREEEVVAVLAIINLVLRFVTKEELTW